MAQESASERRGDKECWAHLSLAVAVGGHHLTLVDRVPS